MAKTSFFDEYLDYLDYEGMRLGILSIPDPSEVPSRYALCRLASDYAVELR